jgi:four helix bundle protein
MWHHAFMRDYKQLKVWKRSHTLTLRVYALTAQFPPEERYALIAQTRRSVSSIPMNVAEGSGRSTRVDYSRFVGYAAASCNEAEYQLLLARDLGYISMDDYEPLRDEFSEVRSMLTRLRQVLVRADAGD